MSTTTLLLGGPLDGELLAVAEFDRPIFAAAPGELKLSFENTEGAVVEPRHSVYRPQRLNFFDIPMNVHVHESLDGDQLPVYVARHLVSAKGEAVMVK